MLFQPLGTGACSIVNTEEEINRSLVKTPAVRSPVQREPVTLGPVTLGNILMFMEQHQ